MIIACERIYRCRAMFMIDSMMMMMILIKMYILSVKGLAGIEHCQQDTAW